ncbi:MAG: LysE family translocator [Sphingobium sp.]
MIVSTGNLIGFAAVSLGMALTPGPNMIYLVSRSITQGRRAGLISLVGVVAAFIILMLAAALGLTALLMAVPFAYDAIRLAGAAYLFWLAWQSLRPGGSSPFSIRPLRADTPRRLLAMGFLTNILNPKAVVLYLSLLPQFIDVKAGHVFAQSISLCTVQMMLSATVNGIMVMAAGTIAGFLATRPSWAMAQRWLMGTVLGGLAMRMALDARR